MGQGGSGPLRVPAQVRPWSCKSAEPKKDSGRSRRWEGCNQILPHCKRHSNRIGRNSKKTAVLWCKPEAEEHTSWVCGGPAHQNSSCKTDVQRQRVHNALPTPPSGGASGNCTPLHSDCSDLKLTWLIQFNPEVRSALWSFFLLHSNAKVCI